MTEFLEKELPEFPSSGLDLTTFGQRLRHLRRARGYTLAELGTRVGRAPSALSLLENGRREPKLSLIESLATALSVPAEELLRHQPPSRRAQLEIAVEEAQRDPLYADLGLPHLKVGARVPNDVLEHLVALYAGTAQAAHPADRDPGGGAGGQRGAARRDAGAGQLLRPRSSTRRRRRWSPSATGAARCPRARCWPSSAITASRSGTPRISRAPSGPSPTCATGGST